MTAHRDLKSRIRARMVKTGESYCTARLHIMAERERLFGPSRSTPAQTRRFDGPMLRIVCDLRYEFVSVLARLAKLQDCSEMRHNAYARDVDAAFGQFREHRAVQTLRHLVNDRGFHYGYLIDLAVKLVDTATLAERMSCAPPFWDRCANWTEGDTRDLAADMRAFALESNWASFERRWLDGFRQAVNRLESAIEPRALEVWLNDYLGTHGTTRFLLTPAFLIQEQSWSTVIESEERPDEHYVFVGSSNGADERGIPWFRANTAADVAERFLILRTNAEVSIHNAALRSATKAVFTLVDTEWYDDYERWHANLARSLRHAIAARFLLATQGPEAAKCWVERHTLQYFWLEPLTDLFGEYEAERARYPRLHEFFPRIASFFEQLGATENIDRFQRERGATRERCEANSPRIVKFTPPNGAVGVEVGTREIEITFDRVMAARSATVPAAGYEFPKIVERATIDETGTVFTLRVELEPETEYAMWLNVESFLGFQDAARNYLVPTLYRFATRANAGSASAR